MKKYELVLMVNPSMKEKDRSSFLAELEKSLWKSVLDKDEIAIRDLEYDLWRVRWNNKAYFVSYYLDLDQEQLDELRKNLLYKEWLMRYFLFSLNNSEVFYKLDELIKKMDETIASWEDNKFWSKLSFFRDERNSIYLTWKALPMLKKYMTRFGDIKKRKYTNNAVSTQKKLRSCIIRAREMWLLPYIK